MKRIAAIPLAAAISLAAAILLTAAGGCSTADHLYICRDDTSCVIEGVQGLCVPGGAGKAYCAFADSKCPSGYRWDDSAPPVIDGQCVPFLTDGGADD